MASKNITDCESNLQKLWPSLKIAFETKFQNCRIILTCTHRPVEEQFEIFKEGRKEDENGIWQITDWRQVKTMRDGIKRLSLHNFYPAKAFDVSILNEKNIAILIDPVKPMPPQWGCLPDLAKSIGLENGGNWTKLHDWCHFQIPLIK